MGEEWEDENAWLTVQNLKPRTYEDDVIMHDLLLNWD